MNELIILAIANIDDEEDQRFMSALYFDYSSLMYKKALEYVQNEHDAEDIAHDVYEKLIQKVSTLKQLNPPALVTYILNSVENTSLNFLKRRNKTSDLMVSYGDDNAINDIRDDSDTPEEIVIDKHTSEEIHRAMEQLNPKYKLVLKCKYFENMSDKDIAKIESLSIKPDSVRPYLARARDALRKILKGAGL